LAGGINLYQYALNVLGWVEPLGLNSYGISTGKIARGGLDFSIIKDGAVFWSGQNMRTAQQWAIANGKMTLE